MSADFTLEPLGQDALLIRFGERIDAALNARVHAAARALQVLRLDGVVEFVPAYASLAVLLDPARGDAGSDAPARYAEAIRIALTALPSAAPVTATALEIPVCYGGEFGPDLAAAAARSGLSEAAFVALHAGADYQVAMLGFVAGFPYLLGLDPRLQQPRREQPRSRVAAGSVAIGGLQTGIYPRALPGGWNLIGRTPLGLFDAAATPPNRLAPGQHLRFRAIDAAEFARLQAA